jgi:hypothetical protein
VIRKEQEHRELGGAAPQPPRSYRLESLSRNTKSGPERPLFDFVTALAATAR